ncbi:Tm-1-like ATP-binding domain-containing protein [Bauldia sp.]|uniref:Tm-1-like ATP-binding domain-containing protein n=1 Tax=Bauldia sp. TaxID=2575872 RepID=UPI003BAC13D4
MARKVVAILGTLDSKGAEFAFLKDRIEAERIATLVIDAGVLGPPGFPPDISANDVAAAAGADLPALADERDRGKAVSAMAAGATAVVARLHDEGRIHGIISMGGGGGTAIGTAAMRALPIGVPKLMVSTLASGDVSALVDVKDIVMMPSVVDIAGINSLSSRILANAAGAIAGMVQVVPPADLPDRPMIAATMFGVTTPCVTRARELLEAAGYEVLVFHATGTGGRGMEALVRGGFIAGVLDITTTELADELVGGVLSAGPDRLEAAGAVGIPQVVSVGALDMANFGKPETVPAEFAGRSFYAHNPQVTLMRTTAAENAELGRRIAAKLNRATGPTVLMLPTRGVSLIAVDGQPFHDPDADAALFDALKANLAPTVTAIELDTDINDPAFAEEAARQLLDRIPRSR